MPPFTPEMARKHKHGLSDKQIRQWCQVAQSTFDACRDRGGTADTCEAQAIRVANGVTGAPANNEAIHLAPASLATNTASLRYETLDDSSYLVAQAVAIIAGVLNDHLVSAEDIAEVLPSFQGIPIPLNHPMNHWGEPISANSPEVLAQTVRALLQPAA